MQTTFKYNLIFLFVALILGMNLHAKVPQISLKGLDPQRALHLKVPTPKTEKPFIIGHRGACGYIPEHTLESYKKSIEMGADFVETDVVSTKDGVLMARHEYEISETTNIEEIYPERKTVKTVDGVTKAGWYIEDFTFAELQKVKAKERLPYRDQSNNAKLSLVRTEEIIQLIQAQEKIQNKKIGFYPEIKHSTYLRNLNLPIKCMDSKGEPTLSCHIEDKLLELLKKYNYDQPGASSIIIQSFEVSNLIEIRNKIGPLSNYKLLQLLDEPQMQPGELIGVTGETLTYHDMLNPLNLARIAQYADGIGPWKRMLINEDPKTHKLLPANNIVKNAHHFGLFVHPYTFRSDLPNLAPEYHKNALNEYIEFFNLGVDGVFTDFAQDGVAARSLYLQQNKSLQH